jgi:outer membrane protein assembly factor BamB
LRTEMLAFAVGVAVLVTAVLGAVPVAGGPSMTVRILFDLGDGSYVWATGTIPDSTATNATWLAVESAASANGVALVTTWYPDYGVFINAMGGRPAYVGIFEWNTTSRTWQLANVGISKMVPHSGDTIAVYSGAYESTSFALRRPVPTPDHPQPALEFRGDLSNSGVAGSAAPDRIRVSWDRDTGKREIGSTPAVADGKVFVTTMGWTMALDAANGNVLWNTSKAKGFSSPAVFNNSVYVGTSSGTVVRLNVTDGALLWETRLLARTSFSGITSSPKVAYDRVFVGTFNETGGPGEAVALWEGNGSVAWRHSTGSIHYSSPAYADATVYVGIMGLYNTTSQVSFNPPYGVLSLDAVTGMERWFFATRGSVAASPAVLGPNLIVPAKDGTVYALNRITGALVWEAAVDAGISSPAVFGDTVFVGGGAFGGPGRVVALNSNDGSVKWSFAPNGPVQSSLTYAGGRIVFSTNEDHGTVYALNAATGVLAWSFEPSPSDYILGSPVVADGVVYAPSDNGHVYALGQVQPDQGILGSVGVVLVGGAIVGAGVLVGVVWILVRRRSRSGP